MTERVLQLADQGGELLAVLLPLFVNHLVASEGFLQLVEEGADRATDLLRLDRRELPGQVQTIKVVVLDQRIRRVDESNATHTGFEHGQVLLLVLVVTTDREQNLERGEFPLQRRDDTEMSLALVQVQRRVLRLQLVCLLVDVRISVDQVRAEGQGWFNIGYTDFAESWEILIIKRRLQLICIRIIGGAWISRCLLCCV